MTTVTATLTDWLAHADTSTLPPEVLHEAKRCLLNFIGCAIGGRDHDMLAIMERSLLPFSGPATASVIGQRKRVDPLLASLLNGASASAHSFDDTHAEAVVHPGAPVCSAAFAVAQSRRASGADLLRAIALGVEVTCRLSKAISVAPAAINVAWYQTSIAGGVGAAVAAGKLAGLTATQMDAAIGIAVAQASGIRSLQGTMCMLMLAGHAAETGVRAMLLAEQGFASPGEVLEGRYSFTDVFSTSPHVPWLGDDLGQRWEILANVYKAYPCGVVLHPVVDACLDLRSKQSIPPDDVERITVRVNPLAIPLTDRPLPANRTQAQVSLQHWTAVALITGRATLYEGTDAMRNHPTVAALRARVYALADAAMPKSDAEVVLQLKSGATIASGVHHGGARLSDAALEDKLRTQASTVFTPEQLTQLIASIWALDHAESVDQVGDLV